jgi:hypothetical protein
MTILDLLRTVGALLIGTGIGWSFGLLQAAAQRQNQAKEAAGQVKSIWRLMPGSGQRVAYLLLTLVLIQVVCPMLFANGTQWWVSGGLLAGYGYTWLQRLLQLRRANVKA